MLLFFCALLMHAKCTLCAAKVVLDPFKMSRYTYLPTFVMPSKGFKMTLKWSLFNDDDDLLVVVVWSRQKNV